MTLCMHANGIRIPARAGQRGPWTAVGAQGVGGRPPRRQSDVRLDAVDVLLHTVVCHVGERFKGMLMDAETTVDSDFESAVRRDADAVDPFAVHRADDVHDMYAELRERKPICPVRGKPMVLVTRFEDLSEILKNTQLYSSNPRDAGESLVEVGFKSTDPRVAEIYASAHEVADTLVRCDPPTHSRQRRIIARSFTPKKVASDWDPIIQRHANRLFDAIPIGDVFDVMSEFAVPLPIRVIAEILGVEPGRAAEFKRWSDAYVASLGRHLTAEQEIDKATAHVEMQRFFMSEIVRRQAAPADDLLTELASVATAETLDQAEQQQSITLPEAVDMAEQLLVAGNETTTQALGEAARLLGEQPDQLDLARDDLDVRANLVEELLRLSSPILGLFRYSTAEHTRGGTPIGQNEIVAACYASANRDEAMFESAEELRAQRHNARRHLAFGNGIHFCVGAPLARAEIRAFVDGLVDRRLRVEVSEPTRSDLGTFLIRGRRDLHVRFRSI